MRQRVRLHLAHDVPSVHLHGNLTNAEFAADLFVQQALAVYPSTPLIPSEVEG